MLMISQFLLTSALVYFICICNKNQVLVLVLEAWVLVLVLKGLGTCYVSAVRRTSGLCPCPDIVRHVYVSHAGDLIAQHNISYHQYADDLQLYVFELRGFQ